MYKKLKRVLFYELYRLYFTYHHLTVSIKSLLQLRVHYYYKIQHVIHLALFSPHTNLAPSGIRAWTVDMKLHVISIFNNVRVVGNSKWKVEYLYKIESSDCNSKNHRLLIVSTFYIFSGILV